MLLQESLWFKSIIIKYVKHGALVLNIGSSDKYFIEYEQPYIKANVIDVLLNKECILKNIDLKPNEGVDIVGDVTDIDFIKRINSMAPDVIICSNLLEHLSNRELFCEGLMGMISKSTLLIVSVPYSFPYHEDPIDTLYRPNIFDLKKAFEGVELIEGEIVKCGTFFSYGKNHQTKFSLLLQYGRICRATVRALFINSDRFKNLLWNFKTISASCAVFKSREIADGISKS